MDKGDNVCGDERAGTSATAPHPKAVRVGGDVGVGTELGCCCCIPTALWHRAIPWAAPGPWTSPGSRMGWTQLLTELLQHGTG